MSVGIAVAAIMFLGVMAYAVFAGADFGSGVWDLTAGDAERGAPMRSLIDDSIGPVCFPRNRPTRWSPRPRRTIQS